MVQLHQDNIMAITFIRRMGGTRILSLCKESHMQTQTAEVGLQTNLIRVLEDLPQTSSLAHTGCLRL